MIKRRNIISFIVVIGLLFTLGMRQYKMQIRLHWLQQNIDCEFGYYLNNWYSLLFQHTCPEENEAYLQYYGKLVSDESMVKMLYSITSYAENVSLENIFFTIADLSPPDEGQLLEFSDNTIRDIGYAFHNPEDTAAADSALAEMESDTSDSLSLGSGH